MRTPVVMVLLIATAFAAQQPATRKKTFGRTTDGREVYLYTLKNTHGVEVAVTNYGGTVVSLMVTDRNGKFADVVLGFDSLAGYESKDNPYFGAIIGRYANRIANGRFKLDGKEYLVPINYGPNSIQTRILQPAALARNQIRPEPLLTLPGSPFLDNSGSPTSGPSGAPWFDSGLPVGKKGMSRATLRGGRCHSQRGLNSVFASACPFQQ